MSDATYADFRREFYASHRGASSARAAVAYAEEFLGNVAWPCSPDVRAAATDGAHQTAHRVAADLERSLNLPRGALSAWAVDYAMALAEVAS